MKEDAIYDFIVVGAGLTGLSLAFFLQKKGKKVLLLEKENRVGGQIQTLYDGSFVFEKGPNSGMLSNESVLRLFQDLPTCKLQKANKQSAKRQVLYKGKPTNLPTGIISGFLSPLFTWKDKFKLLGEPWRKPSVDALESIGAMTRRRLGLSFYEYAVDPFISGIFAGNAERLVTKFALPKLYRLERDYGSFIKGSLKRRKILKAERKKGITKDIFSVEGGLSKLVESLKNKIEESSTIVLQAQKIQLKRSKGLWVAEAEINQQKQFWKTKQVITAVPAYTLDTLLPEIDKRILAPIISMTYAPVIEVGVGLKNGKKIPKAFGLLIPTIERQKILGILYNSRSFSNRCPWGGASLSFFFGGMKHPEALSWNEKKIEETIKEALHQYFGYSKNIDLQCMHNFKHTHAIPQYEADTPQRLKAIAEIQMMNPGLTLAGGMVDGISIADRIQQAERIAIFLTK